MAITRRLLSAATVVKAKSADKDYDLPDGHGLTLSVRTTGKKIRCFRYQRPCSTAGTNITPGYYPALSLAAARTLHGEYPDLLTQGIAAKKREKEPAEQEQRITDSLFIRKERVKVATTRGSYLNYAGLRSETPWCLWQHLWQYRCVAPVAV